MQNPVTAMRRSQSNLERRLRFLAVQCGNWRNVAARLAHLLQQPPDACEDMLPCSPLLRLAMGPWHQSLLPGASEGEERWRELVAWRHPRVGVNLLQLAILYGDHHGVNYLWQPYFLREDLYRDEDLELENHPLHLALAFRPDCLPKREGAMDLVSDELLQEEGFVHLFRLPSPVAPSHPGHGSLLAQPQQKRPHQCHKAYQSFVCWVEGGTAPQDATSLLTLIRVSALSLAKNNGRSCLEIMLTLVQGRLSGARASAVQLLWALVEELCAGGMTSEVYCKVATHLCVDQDRFAEETLLLICQLVWAVMERPPLDQCQREVSSRVCHAVEVGVPVMQAASLLPRGVLQHCILALGQMEQDPLQTAQTQQYGDACRQLQQALRGRTLQDLCVLAVLEAVRGDVLCVWTLSSLPVPLKQLFRLPFHALYSDLKGR